MYNDISTALTIHLNNLPNKPPIAFENATFTPVNGQMYLRETTLPLNSVNLTLKSRVQRVDLIYQIDIFSPKGQSKHQAQRMQDAIVNHFGGVLRLSHNGRIVEINSIKPVSPIEDGAWMIYPVEVVCIAFL